METCLTAVFLQEVTQSGFVTGNKLPAVKSADTFPFHRLQNAQNVNRNKGSGKELTTQPTGGTTLREFLLVSPSSLPELEVQG